MFVLGNVIKPQGLEPLQFSTKFRAPSARLLEKGYTETDVVRRVGVHRQSVNRWAKEWATGCRSAES